MKNNKDRGYVYVMSNPSMPNLLKIGVTQNSVEERKRNDCIL